MTVSLSRKDVTVLQDATSGSALLEALFPASRNAPAAGFHVITIPARATVFVEGERADALYVVLAGKVKLARNGSGGRTHVLSVMGPTDMFGESSVFDVAPRTVTATALTEVRLARIGVEALSDGVRHRAEFRDACLRSLARRIRRVDDARTAQVATDVPGRLATALLQLGERFGTPSGEGVLVRHDLTQRELAQLVGTSREAVNRALGDFGARGWIRVSPGQVSILHGEPLSQEGARTSTPGTPSTTSPPPGRPREGTLERCVGERDAARPGPDGKVGTPSAHAAQTLQTSATLPSMLAAHRELHSLSLKQAGAQVGATHWVWGTWERGVVPSPDMLRRLAHLLGCSLEDARRAAGPDRVRRPGALGDSGGTGLAKLRTARGLISTQLARRVHVSLSCLSRWESGERTPDARACQSLAAALGISYEEVVAAIDGSAVYESAAVPGLRTLRLAAGMTLTAAATALSVSTAVLSRWEQGRTAPQERLPAIMAIFGPGVQLERPLGALPVAPRPRSPLRRLRDQQGLPVSVVAARVGVEPTTVWAWERGARRPEWATARRLARVLGVPPAAVFDAVGLAPPRRVSRTAGETELLTVLLPELRRWRGISQAQLATVLGVGASTVSGWEHGRHRPDARRLLQLRRWLGADMQGSSTRAQAAGG